MVLSLTLALLNRGTTGVGGSLLDERRLPLPPRRPPRLPRRPPAAPKGPAVPNN